jgi:hypothetical protein
MLYRYKDRANPSLHRVIYCHSIVRGYKAIAHRGRGVKEAIIKSSTSLRCIYMKILINSNPSIQISCLTPPHCPNGTALFCGISYQTEAGNASRGKCNACYCWAGSVSGSGAHPKPCIRCACCSAMDVLVVLSEVENRGKRYIPYFRSNVPACHGRQATT